MDDDTGSHTPSRRSILKTATISAAGMALVGGAQADHTPIHDEDEGGPAGDYGGKGVTCGYDNVAAGQGFVFPEHHEACAGDHPETRKIKEAVQYSLDHLYSDVPTLVANGFIPYFDIASVGGFSHWLNAEHIRGEHMVDPGRPETVLVNNNNYCAQGMMFIPNYEVANREPPVYVEGDPDAYTHEFIYPKRENQYGSIDAVTDSGDAAYYNSEVQGYYEDYERAVPTDADLEGGTVCAPWHRHTDGAARFAWWYHRQVNQAAALQNEEVLLWCIVPAMFHVWPGADDDSIHIYEHDSPNSNRTDNTLCHGSYESGPSYLPDDGSELTLDDLPADLRERAMPDDLRRELEILSDHEDEELYGMTIGQIKSLVR